ncbi:MAG: hypothetical protein WA138_11245 [Parvibaculum sp.]
MLSVRSLILLAVAVLLSGCFVSTKPLFVPTDADMPLANGARLMSFSLDEKGARTTETPSHITATRKAHSYIFTPDDDEALGAMFDDIGQGYFVGLTIEDDPGNPPLYGLFHRIGDRWFAYSPVCSDFKKLAGTHGKSLADFHIATSGGDCQFTSYDDLKNALMFLAAYSHPETEYVIEE